jgi:hypothetical protein
MPCLADFLQDTTRQNVKIHKLSAIGTREKLKFEPPMNTDERG